MMNKIDTTHFTTEYGASIHRNIEEGRTYIFDNEKDADECAGLIRRYKFPVFEDGKTNGYWAVPK